MLNLGQPAALSVTVTDSAGAAADADSVTCTITKPDGTTSTPSVSNPSTGTYTATFTDTSTEGRYAVAWVATGANAATFSDVFDVRDASAALISLADAKAALNVTTQVDDDELQWYILAATDLIERHVGAIIPRSVTETVTSRGYLALSTTPVLSVTSVTPAFDNGTTYTGPFTVNGPAGLVYLTDRAGFDGDVYTVTYTAGRPGVAPLRWVQACKVLVDHLWQTQRGSSSGGFRRGGEEPPTSTFSMPNRVLELLQFDFLPPSVA